MIVKEELIKHKGDDKLNKVKVIEKINMCNDAMFKSVFRSIEARGVVVNFLSAITGIRKEILETAEFIGGDIVKSNIKEKTKISDVIVKLDDNNKIIVEMNGSYDKNIFNKNTEYAFSIQTESTYNNKKYNKTILVNIDNFNEYKTDKPILHFKLRDEYGNIENEIYNSIHLILENAIKKEYNKTVEKDIINFSKFLKLNSLKEMEEEFKGDDNYMAAIRKVEDLSTDPKFIGYYDLEEAHKQDIEDAKETGYDEGMEKGSSQKAIEIAKNMLSYNMPIEEISKYTGLSKEEIVNIK